MKRYIAKLHRNKWMRLGACVLIPCFLAALGVFSWGGWQLAQDYARLHTVAQLSAMKVSVYHREPTQIGMIVGHLPSIAKEPLTNLIGDEALSQPISLLATQIGAADIDALVQNAKQLPALKFIVLMERQLQQDDVMRLRRSLPNVEIVEAAFISTIVFTR